MTVASAKAGVWQNVRTKCSNPKAKTIVSGKSLIIIPDDSNTLEVMRGIDNIIELGPRKPRVIIYDVDSGIGMEELTECLLTQNTKIKFAQHNLNRSQFVSLQLRDFCAQYNIDVLLLQEPLVQTGRVYGFEDQRSILETLVKLDGRRWRHGVPSLGTLTAKHGAKPSAGQKAAQEPEMSPPQYAARTERTQAR